MSMAITLSSDDRNTPTMPSQAALAMPVQPPMELNQALSAPSCSITHVNAAVFIRAVVH
ncbi:hypothetical protein D3C76_1843100 [compost metagenome]